MLLVTACDRSTKRSVHCPSRRRHKALTAQHLTQEPKSLFCRPSPISLLDETLYCSEGALTAQYSTNHDASHEVSTTVPSTWVVAAVQNCTAPPAYFSASPSLPPWELLHPQYGHLRLLRILHHHHAVAAEEDDEEEKEHRHRRRGQKERPDGRCHGVQLTVAL